MFLHHFYPDRGAGRFRRTGNRVHRSHRLWQIETGEFWGNFPQTYSMLGQTNAAMHLSRHWDDVL